MELEFIAAGQIVNTHGVRGEVKLLPQGVDPETLLDCRTLYIAGKPVVPTARRIHKGCVLLKLPGVEDRQGRCHRRDSGPGGGGALLSGPQGLRCPGREGRVFNSRRTRLYSSG